MKLKSVQLDCSSLTGIGNAVSSHSDAVVWGDFLLWVLWSISRSVCRGSNRFPSIAQPHRKTIPVMLSSCLTTLHHDFESYKNYNCWGAARFSPSYLHPALFPPRPSICAAFSSVAWYRGWADPLSWHTVGRNWGRGSWGIRQWWLPAQQNYLRAGFWNKIEVLFIPDWASCEKLWMRDMKSLRFTKFVHPTTITTMARKSM